MTDWNLIENRRMPEFQQDEEKEIHKQSQQE